jgi:hypothetical protein
MKVRYQYTDHTEWEGPPEKAHTSPDKGIIRMIVIDDGDYELWFTYQDIYYLYPKDGGFLFGGCNPWKEYIIKPGQAGCSGEPRPFELPENATIRHGETVSQEEAVKFGLIKSVDEKTLHAKRRIKTCKECDG